MLKTLLEILSVRSRRLELNCIQGKISTAERDNKIKEEVTNTKSEIKKLNTPEKIKLARIKEELERPDDDIKDYEHLDNIKEIIES